MTVDTENGPEMVDRTNKIQLNHYTVGSKADFQEKLKRGGGDGNNRPKNYLKRIDEQCAEDCYEGVEAGIRCLGEIKP